VDTWNHDTVRWYWSADTLFWQLSIDHNIDVQSAFSWAPKVARKSESKHWYACGAHGRSVARSLDRSVTWLPNFLGWVDLFTYGAPLARFVRGALLWSLQLMQQALPLPLPCQEQQCRTSGEIHVSEHCGQEINLRLNAVARASWKKQHHDPAGSTTSDALMLSVQQEFSTKLIEKTCYCGWSPPVQPFCDCWVWQASQPLTTVHLVNFLALGFQTAMTDSSCQIYLARIKKMIPLAHVRPNWFQWQLHIHAANKNSIKMIGTIILWFKDSSKCRQNLKRIVYVTGDADKLSLSQESFAAPLGRISLHFPTMDEALQLTPATKPDKASEATGKTNPCTNITSTWECTNSTTYIIPSNQV